MSKTAARDRGRSADKPSEIPAKGWKDVLLRVKEEMGDDHTSLVAAGVAFYGLLAIFPAIGAVVSIWALVSSPEQIVRQLEGFAAMLPPNAAEILLGQARSVADGDGAGHGFAAVFGIVLALWSASKGMKSLIEGLNIAYDEKDDRNFIRSNLVSLGLTALAVVSLIIAVAVIAAIPIVLNFLNLGSPWDIVVSIAPWPVLFFGGVLVLSAIYRFGPDRDRAKWRWLSWGAAVAMAIWLVGSIVFSIYVSNFGNYNATYGAIGGVIVLLLWLWLSSLSVLVGGEVNAELERQTRKDTTGGRPERMGRRGAHAADTLGESKG